MENSILTLQEYKGEKVQWDKLLYEVEILVATFPNSRTRIVNYFLKTVRDFIVFDGNHFHINLKMLEVVSNVYILDINSKSTTYLLAIYVKLFNKVSQFRNNLDEKAKNETEEKNLKSIQKRIGEANNLKEKLFQHLYTILKNNLKNISNMYDIIVFMKLLDKKLSPSFLCEVLEENKKNYFVVCSVAYYILDESFSNLESRFKTVLSKLYRVIRDNIFNYEIKGATEPILEGEFFYFLNDFSKYPGFSSQFRIDLSSKLIVEYTKTCQTKSIVIDNERKKMWGKLTKTSYYEWNTKIEVFIRRIVKKSSNMGRIDHSSDY
ncbi:hypothetical protein [Gracilibacillus alcaliphilus]|uniref:hypothetical protein n=1 Tax=Gracilibacillus alcaliphilus TaxID=1401441 RepID=UPI00195E3A8A|nr:hypothetical protein [Gracilibacillus alcaliphilus]MBM7679788.1 hypothetical protein [Gracilibacillus alcaliphilus]